MKLNFQTSISSLIACSSLLFAAQSAHAVSLKLTFTNFDLGNGSSFSPIGAVFHKGDIDNFDLGEPVLNNIEYAAMDQLAEVGGAVERNAAVDALNRGAITSLIGTGPILAGDVVSTTIDIEPVAGQSTYFNYAAMFVPSNDAFIGNDDELAIQVFDEFGNFNAQNIDVLASRIWDVGSELNNEEFGDAAIPGSGFGASGSPLDPNPNVRFHPGYLADGNIVNSGFSFPSTANPDAVVANITIEAVEAATTPETSALFGLFAIGTMGFVSTLKQKSV